MNRGRAKQALKRANHERVELDAVELASTMPDEELLALGKLTVSSKLDALLPKPD